MIYARTSQCEELSRDGLWWHPKGLEVICSPNADVDGEYLASLNKGKRNRFAPIGELLWSDQREMSEECLRIAEAHPGTLLFFKWAPAVIGEPRHLKKEGYFIRGYKI